MMESHPALIGSCEEHTAFMVERYGAQLVGLCSRLLRDHDLAQDASTGNPFESLPEAREFPGRKRKE